MLPCHTEENQVNISYRDIHVSHGSVGVSFTARGGCKEARKIMGKDQLAWTTVTRTEGK